MSKTVNGLLSHCKACSDWLYVYGAKGRVYSRAEILALQKQYGKDMVWDSDLNKAGHVCCDCSGLISSYTGILRGSSNYKANASQTITIAELKANWSKYIGWAIYMPGHIGVVSDSVNKIYEMNGSAKNWRHQSITANKWTCAFPICDIAYNREVPTSDSFTLKNGSLKCSYAHSLDKTLAGTYQTTSDLNLRCGAGTSYGIIGVIGKGTKVNNYGYYTTVGGVKWLYVKVGSYVGFVSSKYLEKVV